MGKGRKYLPLTQLKFVC